MATYTYTGVGANGRPTAYVTGPARCNRYTFESIVPDEHMHSVFAGLTQELNSSLRVDLRAFWSQRKTTNYNAQGLDNEQGRGTAVSKLNPFYTPTPAELANPALLQGVNVSLTPAVGENLPSNTKYETWGVSGQLAADLFGDFQARLLGNYNEAAIDQVTRAAMDQTLLTAALARTDSTALNPYNPAATPGSILVAQQIANHPTFSNGLTRQTQVRLVADGSLFHIGGGDVKVALGAELVHENFDGAQETRNYLGNLDGARQSLTGTRTVKSVFGELDIPLISPESDGPINSLRLSAAARYDHYSDFGGTFNPRFAATIKPVEWVTLRGTYGKSFLAPSLPQLFSAQTVARSTSPFINPPGASSILILQGGNPNLSPQKATTWSLGLDVDVPFVDGLRTSLTYYNVNYKDRLGNAGGGPFQFQGGDFYQPRYAAFFIQNPTYEQAVAFIGSSVSPIPISNTGGTVEALYGPNHERTADSPTYISSARVGNLAIQKEDGFDFSVSYNHPTSFGSLDFQVAGNYVLDRDVASDAILFTDALEFDTKFRGSAMVGANVGNFRFSTTVLYTAGRAINPANNVGQFWLEDYTTVNTFLSYTFKQDSMLKDTVLSLQISNLFDVLPPVNINSSTGYGPGDILGRTFQLGLRKKF